jgi:hypothetical protein
MTDRVHSLTVVLEEDMRVDDCEDLMNAICMLKNVVSVTTHVTDVDDHMAIHRVKHEFKKKLWDVLK